MKLFLFQNTGPYRTLSKLLMCVCEFWGQNKLAMSGADFLTIPDNSAIYFKFYSIGEITKKYICSSVHVFNIFHRKKLNFKALFALA